MQQPHTPLALSQSIRGATLATLAVTALLLPRGALSDELVAAPTTEPGMTTTVTLPAGMPEAATPAPPASAEVTAGDAVSMLARPSGPEVQPCRHLPPPQMVECLKITGAIDPRLMR